ncbi:hypothetical protein NDU88_004844 [Pleurodeles waltl]|uniref:Uncharacterized protein n=1 Tax=Pleurodeles waltl TaxID=8319 RepID=A0AAV7SK30_PLEWA|nr:hypothetical protein NDU88_004844 [Pleurodeles waltl]
MLGPGKSSLPSPFAPGKSRLTPSQFRLELASSSKVQRSPPHQSAAAGPAGASSPPRSPGLRRSTPRPHPPTAMWPWRQTRSRAGQGAGKALVLDPGEAAEPRRTNGVVDGNG